MGWDTRETFEMDEPATQYLETIADFAIWTQPIQWLEGPYLSFLTKLYAAGLFLPPLLALDVCSAAEQGQRRPGRRAFARGALEDWQAWMRRLNGIIRLPLSHEELLRSSLRTESAFRVASCVARCLMGQVDVSSLRRSGQFHAVPMLCYEANRLTLANAPHQPDAASQHFRRLKDSSEVSVLTRCHEAVAKSVKSRRGHEFLPASQILTASPRAGGEVDPFLIRMLELDAEPDIPEPPVRGRVPTADNPREDLSYYGEFARRELGPLPDDPSRLAPTELLLLRQATHGPDDERPLYRNLFLLRASQSGLLQRYHRDTRSAQMEPISLLQIDLFDEPEYHRLNDPPHPPVISWYRALAIQLIHQFAYLSAPFSWTNYFRFNVCEGNRVYSAVINAEESEALGISPRWTLEKLVRLCPRAFTGFRVGTPRQLVEQNSQLDWDVWLRIVLGKGNHAVGDSLCPQQRGVVESGLRVERQRDGDWGLAQCEVCSEAHRLPIRHFDLSGESPRVAAEGLIKESLGMEAFETAQAEFE
jgi:hypothetical protein